jgi:hypothetical protein
MSVTSSDEQLWRSWFGFSRVNKSACVRTLPCYKCFIILNQQRTEKTNRSSSKSTSPKLFIWWRHRHNSVWLQWLSFTTTWLIRISCFIHKELILATMYRCNIRRVPRAMRVPKIQMYLNHISSKITEYLINVVPYKSSNAGNT